MIDEANSRLVIHVSKVHDLTTSSYMELSTLSKTIGKFKRDSVNFYTDSKYVVDSYNTWLHGWVHRTNFKGIKYQKEWKAIYDSQRDDFKVSWVKGHNNVAYNELVNWLAQVRIRTRVVETECATVRDMA